MTDDYPTHSVRPNPRSGCTRDEALGIMLGIHSVPDMIDSYYLDGCRNDQDLIDLFHFDFSSTLENMRNEKLNDCRDAESQEEKDKALNNLKQFDVDFTTKARFYMCRIDDELAKGAESELRLKDELITINSFNNWFRNLKASMPVLNEKEIPVNNATSETLEYTHNEDEIDKKLAGFYTTLAFALEDLAKLYAKKGGKKDLLHDNGTVNQEKMAEHLYQLAMDYKYDETSNSNSQSVSSLKPRVSLAFKVRKDARTLVEQNQINKYLKNRKK
jgi:hypothetical protein